jgi:hypothetical protein
MVWIWYEKARIGTAQQTPESIHSLWFSRLQADAATSKDGPTRLEWPALCGLFNFATSGWCATGKLLAGAAKISITPETDEPLHDPVYARSLVLDINGERLAFVALDLGVYTSTDVVAVCKEKHRIAKVFLCSSHNHSAPRRPGKTPETVNLKAFYDGHARESWMGDDHYRAINPERIWPDRQRSESMSRVHTADATLTPRNDHKAGSPALFERSLRSPVTILPVFQLGPSPRAPRPKRQGGGDS